MEILQRNRTLLLEINDKNELKVSKMHYEQSGIEHATLGVILNLILAFNYHLNSSFRRYNSFSNAYFYLGVEALFSLSHLDIRLVLHLLSFLV